LPSRTDGGPLSNGVMVAYAEHTAPSEAILSKSLTLAPTTAQPVGVQASADAAQLRAETAFVRSTIRGAAIGALVCAGIWMGLVAIATVGAGVPLVPTLAMAAGCGVFAGLFLGGSAGALAGSRALERAAHEQMHPGAAPQAQ
jgi:uncharacterized membrane protein YbjE (DUF340 family)